MALGRKYGRTKTYTVVERLNVWREVENKNQISSICSALIVALCSTDKILPWCQALLLWLPRSIMLQHVHCNFLSLLQRILLCFEYVLYKNYPTLDGPVTQTNNKGFFYEK